MTVYKLVDQNYRTRAGQRNETRWEIGVRVEAIGAPNQPLCTNGHIHGYEHPIVAALMNPEHANIRNPRMLICDAEEPILRYGQLKLGARAMTPTVEIQCPELSTKQRVEIAIRCALTIYTEPLFTSWAQQWLDGSDRSKAAAAAAWAAAEAAAAAAWAAEAAAAAWAARAAEAWAAEEAAAEEAAAEAAAAAWAARAAELNLILIVEQVTGHVGWENT